MTEKLREENELENTTIYRNVKDDMITLFELCDSMVNPLTEREYQLMKQEEKTMFTSEQLETLFLDFVRKTFGAEYYMDAWHKLEKYRKNQAHYMGTIDDFYQYVRTYMNSNHNSVVSHYLGKTNVYFGEDLANRFLKEKQVVSDFEADQVKISRYNVIQFLIANTLEMDALNSLSKVYDGENFTIVIGALLAGRLEQLAEEDTTEAITSWRQFQQEVEDNRFHEAMQALGLHIDYDNTRGLIYYDRKEVMQLIEDYYCHSKFSRKSKSLKEKIFGK